MDEKKERYFRCSHCRNIYEMDKLNATNITTNSTEKMHTGNYDSPCEDKEISVTAEYDLCPTCLSNMLRGIKPVNDFSDKSCTFCHKVIKEK